MKSHEKTSILQQLQREWQAEGSIEKGLKNLVKVPFFDRLLDRRSFLGSMCYKFSFESANTQFAAVQRVAFSALKDIELTDESAPMAHRQFFDEWTQYKFRWIASNAKPSAGLSSKQKPNVSPALHESVQKVQALAQKKWQAGASSLKDRLEIFWRFLSTLPRTNTPFSSKEIDRLIHIENTLCSHEDASRWFDVETLPSDSNQWSLIMDAMEANRRLTQNLKPMRGESGALDAEARRLSQIVEKLAKGENAYTHLKIGSQGFWHSKASTYLRDYGIDLHKLETKLAAIIEGGQLEQVESWLDKLFDDLLPSEALDTLTSPIQRVHQIAGPLLPDPNRKVEVLHALFPAFVAEFLESKAQAGAAGVLEPILPAGVNISELLTTLPIDATHTLSQSLRQKSQAALASISQSTVGVLAEQARYFLDTDAPERWLRLVPDQTFCREALIKHTDSNYKTPASVMVKIHRHEEGHFEVTVISSGATVGGHHPKDFSNRFCPFYFPKVSQDQLDTSFFHRLLEWAHASSLWLNLGDESHFYREFLGTLGPVQPLEGFFLEPDNEPYFNFERTFQILGKDIKSIKKRTQELRLQALAQLCDEHRLILEDPLKLLPISVRKQIMGLVEAILNQEKPLEKSPSHLVKTLKIIQDRLKYESEKPLSSLSHDLHSCRREILNSMNNHPVLLKWLLGDQADEILESVVQQLGLAGELQKSKSVKEDSWLHNNKNFFLEVLYASSIVLVAYTTGLMVSALKISATAAFSLLTRYLSRKVDWSQILPKELHAYLEKIKKIYEEAWTWVLLKIREIFVGVISQAIASIDSLEPLKKTLDVIESSREELLKFLKGTDPVIDSLEDIEPYFGLGGRRESKNDTTQANSVHFLWTNHLKKELDFENFWEPGEPTSINAFSNTNKASHRSLREVLLNIRDIPFSDPFLHEAFQVEEKRVCFLRHLNALLKSKSLERMDSLNDWQLKATCFLWMEQVLQYFPEEAASKKNKEKRKTSTFFDTPIRQLLLDQFKFGFAPDCTVESAFQRKQIHSLLNALCGRSLNLEEIEALILSTSHSNPLTNLLERDLSPLECNDLENLPTIKDSELPVASKNFLSGHFFRSRLPYDMTGGVHERYVWGYHWIKICRKWLSVHPQVTQMLAQVAQRWLQSQPYEIQELLEQSIDKEILIFYVFSEVFTSNKCSNSVFFEKKTELEWIRLCLRLHPQEAFMDWLSEHSGESHLHALADRVTKFSKEPTVFSRKCLLIDFLIPKKKITDKLLVRRCEINIVNFEDYINEKLVFHTFYGCFRLKSYEIGDSVDSRALKRARDAVATSSKVRVFRERDVQSSYAKSWTTLGSMVSFLTAHPLYFFDKSLKVKEDFLTLFQSFIALPKNLSEDKSLVNGLAACWQKMWKASPSLSSLDHHDLLLIGFKLECHLRSMQAPVHLGLLEAIQNWKLEFLDKPNADTERMIVDTQWHIAFHPLTACDENQRLEALEASLICPKVAYITKNEPQFLSQDFAINDYEHLECMYFFTSWLKQVSENNLQEMLHRVAAFKLGRASNERWVRCKSNLYVFEQEVTGLRIHLLDAEIATPQNAIQKDFLDQACTSMPVFQVLKISDRAGWKEEIPGKQWRYDAYVYIVENQKRTLYYEDDHHRLLAYNENPFLPLNCEAFKAWVAEHPQYQFFSNEEFSRLQAPNGAYVLLTTSGNKVSCYTFSSNGICHFTADHLPSSFRYLSHLDRKNWIVSKDQKGALTELKHPKINLHFSLREGRIMEVGRFKGYQVAPRQASYASCMPWSSYLVLENDKKEKLALTPKMAQLFSAVSSYMLPDLPLMKMLSYLFSTYTDTSFITDSLPFKLEDNPIYVYAIDQKNRIESNDFGALFHLFTTYALQSMHAESDRVLRLIEEELSGPLEAKIEDRDLLLLCADFLSTPMKVLRIRLAIALAQREMTQASITSDKSEKNIRDESEKNIGQIALIAICLNDYHGFLQQGELTLNQIGLDMRDELALLAFAKSVQTQLMNHVGKTQPILEKLLKNGLSQAIEYMLYPEPVWKRMKLLQNWQSKMISSNHPIEWESYLEGAYNELSANYLSILNEFQLFSIDYLTGAKTFDFIAPSLQELRVSREGEINAHNLSAIICKCMGYAKAVEFSTRTPLTKRRLYADFEEFYELAKSSKREREKSWLEKELRLCVRGWCEESAILVEFLKSVLDHPEAYLKAEESERNWLVRELGKDKHISYKIVIAPFFDLRNKQGSKEMVKKLVPRAFERLANTSLNLSSNLGVSNSFLTGGMPIPAVLNAFQAGKTIVGMVKHKRDQTKSVDRICYTQMRPKLSAACATHVFAHTLGSIDQDLSQQLVALADHLVVKRASKEQTKQLGDKLLPFHAMPQAWQFYRLQEGYDKLQNQPKEVFEATFKEESSAYDLFNELSCLEDNLNGSMAICEDDLSNLVGPQVLRLTGGCWLDRLSHLIAADEINRFFPELSQEEKEAVELLITGRAIMRARLSQIQQAKALFQKLGSSTSEQRSDILILLHAKLASSRHWKFDDTPWNIALPLLIFEGQCGVLLSRIQVETMSKALVHDKGVIYEAIMGGGKSFFGMTFEAFYARSMGLAVLMYPSNVIQGGFSTTSRQGRLAYGQKPHRVVFHPVPKTEEDWLNRLTMVRAAAEAKQPICVTPEDIQSLLLNWYGAHYLSSTPNSSLSDRSLDAMSEILSLLKSQGISIGDEAHVIYDPKKSLRLPLGFKSSFKHAYLEGMSLIWYWLSLDTALMEDLKSQNCYNKPEEESLAKYSSKVASRIEKMYQVEGLARFLCDVAYEPKHLLLHPQYDMFCLYRGVLAICLPQALKGALDVNYGPHPTRICSPAIPYRNSDCPLVDSIIKHPFEAFVKTYLSVTSHGVPVKEGSELIHNMMKARESNLTEQFPGSTLLVERIKGNERWQGYLKEALRGNRSQALSPIAEALANDPLFVGCFISCRVAPNLETWSTSLTCDPQLMAALFARNVAGTGTAAVEGVYPLGVEVQRDVEASADALVTLLAKTSHVISLSSDNPDKILQELLDKHLPSDTKVRIWLDGSALLHGLSMKKIAQKIGERLKESIDFVLYYEGDTLMAWNLARQDTVLASTISVDPQRRFTLYDHAHTVGADIHQGEVEALLLAGPTHQGLLQEAFRLRKLASRRVASLNASHPLGQSLSIVISASARQAFDHDPSVYDIVGEAMKKEIELAKHKNFDASLQKIHAVILMRACMKILEASSLSRRKKLAHKLSPLFLEHQKMDAKIMFGGVFEEADPKMVLMRKSKALLKLAEKLDVDSEDLLPQIDEIVGAAFTMPDYVRVSQGDNLQTLGLEVALSLSLAQEQEQQQELQVTVVTSGDIGYKPMSYSSGVSIHQPTWVSHTAFPGERGLSSNASGVPIYRLDKLMGADEALKKMAPFFEDPIYMTNNLLPIQGVGSEGPAQLAGTLVRPCRSALIYYDSATEEIHSVVALAATDHEFWKSKIQHTAPTSTMRAMLWDIHSMAAITFYEKDKRAPLPSTLALRQSVLKLKLMLGYMHFSVSEVSEEFESWLQESSWTPQNLTDLLKVLLGRRGQGDSCMSVPFMRDLWERNLKWQEGLCADQKEESLEETFK